ncbi:hypothetical protein LG329_01580 [Virgibacillus necropolis]|uniref:sporulation protein YpjB n=1 Tax=Virgibacillus necropolis TaxID=163877 RepID=UPI00384FA9FF
MKNLIYSSIVNLVQSMTSLFWVITAVGGTIVIALAYVSWIKYKEEKKRQKNNSNS